MESIIIFYLTDDEFKVICDDYCLSKVRIEIYKEKKKEDTRCQAQYESLSAELEQEIVRFIKNRNKEDI